jgi:hypothetical protein
MTLQNNIPHPEKRGEERRGEMGRGGKCGI